MKNKLKLIVASAVCVLGIGYSLVVAGTNGLDLWMSGSNNNKLVEIQNQKHSYKKSGDVEVAFFLKFIISSNFSKRNYRFG
jgi:hypothetical protein